MPLRLRPHTASDTPSANVYVLQVLRPSMLYTTHAGYPKTKDGCDHHSGLIMIGDDSLYAHRIREFIGVLSRCSN